MANSEVDGKLDQQTEIAIDRVKLLNIGENEIELEELESEMKKVQAASSSCGLCKIVIGSG
jgi:hypothetical protein